ncbi:thioredoxin [Sphingobacteriales bacterium UPWRP_1]|nr:thioredoxin [Sphingobacteriales bacterium TSM_CSM]PSJ77890.1 thioredoxin [Sphingobacteriales bacterium UPWRP_1]
MALTLTDQNFDTEVLQSGKLAVVDFWAVWCGPCKAIAPIIDDLSKEYDGKIVVGKVDVDTNMEVSMMYNVRNIPTVLFIKNGKVVDKQVGAASKSVYESKIKQHI